MQAAVVRRMLKTRKTLGNVSRFLSNLIESLLFVMFKEFRAKSLFTGRLRIVLVFAILTTTPLVSESLLGNTCVTMTILQKYVGTFS